MKAARFARPLSHRQGDDAVKGATVFRIVGLVFLALAGLIIVRGEFVVGRTGNGGVVVTRVHDPESFWRGVIIQIGVGCAALYLSRRLANKSHQAALAEGIAVGACLLLALARHFDLSRQCQL
jgi:hypothetical protein